MLDIEVRKLDCDCGDWLLRGVGDSSVVRVSDSRLKGPGFESLQERLENFLPQGLLFRYTFHSRVARKKGPGHSARSAGGRLHLDTHAHDACGFA